MSQALYRFEDNFCSGAFKCWYRSLPCVGSYNEINMPVVESDTCIACFLLPGNCEAARDIEQRFDRGSHLRKRFWYN